MKFKIEITGSSYESYMTTIEMEAKDENEARTKVEEMDDRGELEEKLLDDGANDFAGDIEDIDWDIQEMKD